MTGKTHQIIGLTIGISSFISLHDGSYAPATFAAVIAASSTGALLPDIDQPTSDLWNQIPFGRYAGKVTNIFLEHRNFTHSLLGYFLISFGFTYLVSLAPTYWGLDPLIIATCFGIAYASHLLADMVTVMGIPLLFPYQRMFGIPPKPFDGLRILTGKWFENLVIFPLTNIILLSLLISYSSFFQQTLFK